MTARVKRKSVTGHWQHEQERRRELATRQLPCPQECCDAEVGEKCLSDNLDLGNQFSQWSHTGRYLAAVDLGLVPPFPATK
jgi:hypothetical protein